MSDPRWIASMDDYADAVIEMERRLRPLKRSTGFHNGQFYEFISIFTGPDYGRRYYIRHKQTGECQYAASDRDFSKSVALFVEQESFAANTVGGGDPCPHCGDPDCDCAYCGRQAMSAQNGCPACSRPLR